MRKGLAQSAAQDLAGWEKKVAQRGGLNRQIIADALAWAQGMRQRVAERVGFKTDEWRELYANWFGGSGGGPERAPGPLHYQELVRAGMTFGAWLMILLEGIFGALLTAVVTELPVWASGLVGFAMAVVLGFAFKGMFMVILARHQTEPKAARDVLVMLLSVLGIIEIVMLTVAMFIRASSADLWIGYIAWAFGPALGVLSVVTPMLSGLCFCLARLYAWSGEIADELQALARVDGALASFISSCEGQAQAVGASPRSVGAEGSGRAVRASVAILAGLVLMQAVTARPALGQYLFADHSSSTRPEAMQGGIEAIVEVIDVLGLESGVREWRVIPFKGDAWTAAPTTVVAMPVLTVVPCRPRGAAGTIFTRVRQDQQQECGRQEGERRRAYEAEMKEVRQTLREALTPRPAGRTAHCSSVTAALTRMSLLAPGSVAVLVTDAEETCRTRLGAVPAPRGPVRAIVVLVPPKAAGPLVDEMGVFAKQRDTVLRASPWLRAVVPPWGLRQAVCGEAAGSVVPVATGVDRPRCTIR